MREFVYFSRHAVTTGNFKDLMKAGRMDIAIHTLINCFFLSHKFREDVKLHLVFYGPPDPPKHIEIQLTKEFTLSKKDIGNLIKKVLYKYKKNKRTEVFPNVFIEKKSLLHVIEELINDGKKIFVLDKKGEDIRKIKNLKNSVFILGDQDGFPLKEMKRLKKISEKVSVGPKIYFASQTITIVNNELDRREYEL